MRNLADELEQLAPPPRDPLDVPALLDRSRRLRRRRVSLAVVASVIVAGASAALWETGIGSSDSRPVPVVAGTPRDGEADAKIRAIATSLEKQIERMRSRKDELRHAIARTRAQLLRPLERPERVVVRARLDTLKARRQEVAAALVVTERQLRRVEAVLEGEAATPSG